MIKVTSICAYDVCQTKHVQREMDKTIIHVLYEYD